MDIVKNINSGVKTYMPHSLFGLAWDDRLNFLTILRLENFNK